MKISSVSNKTAYLNKHRGNNKAEPAFKSIFIEKNVRLGDEALQSSPPVFLPKDALFLNELASKYPDQDCFIRAGEGRYPRLEYRERPLEVELFYETAADYYRHDTVPDDKEYPCIPLIIHPDSDINKFIGLPSYVSLNPSLINTVRAGYELHKKIMDIKYQILDILGHNDTVDLGGKTIVEKSTDAAKETETALIRYLLEDALESLKDDSPERPLYTSPFAGIKSRLDAQRRFELTISNPKLNEMRKNEIFAEVESACRKIMKDKPDITEDEFKERIYSICGNALENYKESKQLPFSAKMLDICENAVRKYPNRHENEERIKEIIVQMNENRMFLR